MAKFKVGDKVRVREDLEYGKIYNGIAFVGSKTEQVGRIFTIERVDEEDDTYVVVEYCGRWGEDMLESAAFSKSDLKDGMVVDIRNGNRYIVINDGLRRNDTWLAINPYLDDLTRKKTKEYDVMKVYTTVGNTLEYMFDDLFLKLVWERPEEYIEMTVAEIEEKLGYKVKVIADEK